MSDAIFMALLTPPGRGAIATLAVYGVGAWQLLREHFQRPGGRDLPAAPLVDRFWLGTLGEPGKGGRDEVVLSVRRLTPTPWLEIHCHGGDQAVAMLQEQFAEQGITACSWQELERHAGVSRLQVLAQERLALAPTLRTARILLDQYHGALETALHEALALIEAGQRAAAADRLGTLTARRALGLHLVEPWRVVIAGPPNAGKSSLVNAIAGFSRCLVSPRPGTTRDIVTTTVAIDGWPVELADTAGWHDAADALEREGIDRARELARHADLCLWLLDGSAPPVFPAEIAGNVKLVINKIDLPAAWQWDEVVAVGRVSARSGAGVNELCTALARTLVPQPPPAGAAMPFTFELAEQTERAERACAVGDGQQAVAVIHHTVRGGPGVL